MNSFPFDKPQTSNRLPVNLEITENLNNNAAKNKTELRKRAKQGNNYITEYNNTIGISGKWYMSEKLDGIRAIWTGSLLLTKSMRPFTYVPDWFIKRLPKGTSFDGELYIPGLNFQTFSSLSITKKSPEVDDKWKKVLYIIFDMPLVCIKFEDRLNRLKRLKMFSVSKFMVPFVKIIEFKLLNDIRNEFFKVNNLFKEVLKKNGEGIMLIKADSMYESKRCKHSLKYKKEYRDEAEVISYHEGLGKYHKKLGKYKCKIPKTGKTFFCGTGLSDELRSMYHFDKTVCEYIDEDKPNLKVPKIGDIITYSCMEILPSGIPRMSVFKGLRHDL